MCTFLKIREIQNEDGEHWRGLCTEPRIGFAGAAENLPAQEKKMNHIYFVADFTYNPQFKNPLKILELGDAFTAGWVTKKIGKEGYFVRDRFIMDLKKQYPDALLVNVMGYGIDLIDLSSDETFHFYDKSDLFNNSTSAKSLSRFEMIDLIEQTLMHSGKRANDSRLLLINIGPNISIDPRILNESEHLKIANHNAGKMKDAFYNKKVFDKFASGSSIYPETLFLDSYMNNYENEIDNLIEKSEADDFVLKPINGTRSEGVHVVSSLKLKDTLYSLKRMGCYPDLYDAFHNGILIQACCPSQSIKFEGDSYFAKGRAVIRADLISPDNSIKLNFLAGYWQLAQHPNTSGVSDDTLIACGSANRSGVLEIEEKEWDVITGLFEQHLPSILSTMLLDNDSFCQIFLSSPSIPSIESYEKSLKLFLHKNFLSPSGPEFLQKIYYWCDTNIAKIGIDNEKKFVIDLVGVSSGFKNSLSKDNHSIDVFSHNAISNLYDNRHAVLNESFDFSNYLWRKHQDLIICFLLSFIVNNILNDNISASESLARSVFSSFLLMGISEGIEYYMGGQRKRKHVESSNGPESKKSLMGNIHRFFSGYTTDNTQTKAPLNINSGQVERDYRMGPI